MTISMVYTRGGYHVIFSKKIIESTSGTANYTTGSVTIEHSSCTSLEVIAPYWLVTRLSRLDTWKECSDDKIHVLLGNPSRFIMNLIREGFRKDLSLILVYQTMQELVS